MVKLLKLPYSRYTKIISPNFPESPRAHRGSNRPGAEPAARDPARPVEEWGLEPSLCGILEINIWYAEIPVYIYIYILNVIKSSNQAIKSNQMKSNQSIIQSINQINQYIYTHVYIIISDYIYMTLYDYICQYSPRFAWGGRPHRRFISVRERG